MGIESIEQRLTPEKAEESFQKLILHFDRSIDELRNLQWSHGGDVDSSRDLTKMGIDFRATKQDEFQKHCIDMIGYLKEEKEQVKKEFEGVRKSLEK